LRFLEAIGTKDPGFANGMMRQLANIALVDGKPDEDVLNFVTSVVTGLEPSDQVEAMLAARMAAIHLATVTFSRRLAHVENIPHSIAFIRELLGVLQFAFWSSGSEFLLGNSAIGFRSPGWAELVFRR
jgi:hypothetical protein